MAARIKNAIPVQASRGKFRSPLTISRKDLLKGGSDDWLRDTIYRLVQSLDRLLMCRDAFGRQLGLTSSQFAVLIGVAYRQGDEGISIAALSSYIGLAATHVTTEVGRLIRKDLLKKSPNSRDRRSVLVTLTLKGEGAILEVAPVVRSINDLLFEGIDRDQLEKVNIFAASLIQNSEYAAAEIRVVEARRPAVAPKGRKAAKGA
jgi:MarR family transcriptional regulator, organic hydroperoxide resistance regulator